MQRRTKKRKRSRAKAISSDVTGAVTEDPFELEAAEPVSKKKKKLSAAESEEPEVDEPSKNRSSAEDRKATIIIAGLHSSTIRPLCAAGAFLKGDTLLLKEADCIKELSQQSADSGHTHFACILKDYSIGISVHQSADDLQFTELDCDCPDARPGICKHLCALLLHLCDATQKKATSTLLPKKVSIAKSMHKNKTNDSSANIDSISSTSSKWPKTSAEKVKSGRELAEIISTMRGDELKLVLLRVAKSGSFEVQRAIADGIESLNGARLNLSAVRKDVHRTVHQLDAVFGFAQSEELQRLLLQKCKSDLFSSALSRCNAMHKRGDFANCVKVAMAITQCVTDQSLFGFPQLWRALHAPADDCVGFHLARILRVAIPSLSRDQIDLLLAVKPKFEATVTRLRKWSRSAKSGPKLGVSSSSSKRSEPKSEEMSAGELQTIIKPYQSIVDCIEAAIVQ